MNKYTNTGCFDKNGIEIKIGHTILTEFDTFGNGEHILREVYKVKEFNLGTFWCELINFTSQEIKMSFSPISNIPLHHIISVKEVEILNNKL